MGGLFETSELQGDLKNIYSKQEILDYNAFGVIHKCKESKTGKFVAIKIINKKYLEKICGQKNLEKCLEIIRQEIETLKKMSGDYSLQFMDAIETTDSIYVLTEIWDSNLETFLLNKKVGLSIKEIKHIFKKLNIVFKRMKQNNVIHGNLNLNNILLKGEKNEPLLSDYGKKGKLDEKLNIMQSTSQCSSPEILIGENYDYKTDLWSIGVILYKLYFNEFPYNGETQVSIYNDIIRGKKIKKCEENSAFNDLIKKLLIIEPNNRMDWDEYFSHKFWEDDKEENLNSNDKKRLEEKLENERIEKEYNEKKQYKFFYKQNIKMPNKKYYNIYYCLYTLNNEKTNYIPNLESPKKIEIMLQNGNNEQSIDNFIYQELTKEVQFEYLSKLILYGCNLKTLDILKYIPATNLLDLDLSRNKIDNIDALTEISYDNLLFLNLSNNMITDISPLTKVTFKNLRHLLLSHNLINNIEALTQVPFIYLDKLKLSSNNITNIDTFANVPFTNLTYLNLSKNKITDASKALAYISIKNLLHLDLSHNKIKTLDGLNVFQYKNLITLELGDNDISNIDLFKEVYFSDLIKLSLNDNNLDNGYIFAEVPFKDLKELNLSYNNFENIDFINYVVFQNLEKLDMNGNKISDLTPLNQLLLNGLKELEIKYNKLRENEGNYIILNNLKAKYNDLKILYN